MRGVDARAGVAVSIDRHARERRPRTSATRDVQKKKTFSSPPATTTRDSYARFVKTLALIESRKRNGFQEARLFSQELKTLMKSYE